MNDDHLAELLASKDYNESVVLGLREDNLQLKAENKKLRDTLASLYAIVKGECPSLLDEDSGGYALIDMAVLEALRQTEGGKE